MQVNISQGQSGNSGVLDKAYVFEVMRGVVYLSTDGGITEVPRGEADPFIFATGLTVTWRNSRAKTAILNYMPA